MKRFGFIQAIVLAFALVFLPGRATGLEVGDKAPDFELPSTQGSGKF